MKKLLILSVYFLLACTIVRAQVPGKFNYQAVIRNNAGELVINQNVEIQLSIHDNTAEGAILYTESHTVTSNAFGLINLQVGSGTSELGEFSAIDWGTNNKFLEIEVNIGSGFINLGTVQLLSVPYALYANDVANKDDADADATNEFQDLSLLGTDLSLSNSSNIVDLSSILDGVDDADNDPLNELQDLVLNGDTLEITNGNRITFPYDSSRWVANGNNLYYNTGNVGIGSTNPVSNLEVKSNLAGTDALFQVINSNNDTVFAVYPDGVKVFVDHTAKGKVGGFAVSGRNPAKAGEEVEYMRVTNDSTRIYVNESTVKGQIGGFAVSGRNPAKGIIKDYLQVTRDSTRIYVEEPTTKGKVGGFAVSGRNPAKATTSNFMDITPENSFIGLNAGKSITTGTRNAFMGYQAGMATNDGFDNVFIGNNAGLNNTSGKRNIFIGTNSGQEHTTGYQNIAIGLNSGQSLETGLKNVFIGTVAGASNVEGNDNVFIGNYAGYSSTASSNVYIGRTTGMNNTVGEGNVFIGEQSGRLSAEGSGNVFIGKEAGMLETGSNKLYISNAYSNTLIYGEFDNREVEVNGSLKIKNVLNIEPTNVYPGTPERGDVLYDENSNSIKYYNGSSWMELSATVAGSPPTVTTDSISKIVLADSCTIYGTVGDPSGNGITEMGVLYYHEPFNDLIVHNKVHSSPGVGSMEISLTSELTPGDTYYARIYAKSADTTSMGDIISFDVPLANDLPAIETSAILNITQTKATGGGNVTSSGGTELIAIGICWGTDTLPTIENDTTLLSPTMGEFTSIMTGLTAETTYHVRAYATNASGTTYGEEVSFNTASFLPVVETSGVVEITKTTATGGGSVDMPGGITITEMGICWSTLANPTIADNNIPESVTLGSFTSSITGLTAETTYYVRAYATNSYGTTYGNEIIFITASDVNTVTDINGNVYNTVQIGTKTWMKENLKATKYNDGTDILNITVNSEWDVSTEGAYRWYDDDSVTYYDPYGALYNYYVVSDSRNVCPTGWHVATDTEWFEMMNYLGGIEVAGNSLKESGTTHWSIDSGADNSTGFTALPGGYYFAGLNFETLGSFGQWWAADRTAWIYYMQSGSPYLGYGQDKSNSGSSIRCIKD